MRSCPGRIQPVGLRKETGLKELGLSLLEPPILPLCLNLDLCFGLYAEEEGGNTVISDVLISLSVSMTEHR